LKYVFLLVLLIIASAGALLAGVIGYRWLNNMTQTAKLVPGERVFAMPSGVVREIDCKRSAVIRLHRLCLTARNVGRPVNAKRR